MTKKGLSCCPSHPNVTKIVEPNVKPKPRIVQKTKYPSCKFMAKKKPQHNSKICTLLLATRPKSIEGFKSLIRKLQPSFHFPLSSQKAKKFIIMSCRCTQKSTSGFVSAFCRRTFYEGRVKRGAFLPRPFLRIEGAPAAGFHFGGGVKTVRQRLQRLPSGGRVGRRRQLHSKRASPLSKIYDRITVHKNYTSDIGS